MTRSKLPTRAEMKGPAADTNWLIPGRLLVGAAPTALKTAKQIAAAGVDVFVSLLDYSYDYKRRFKLARYETIAETAGVILLKFPIEDGDVAPDEEVFRLARQIYAMLSSDVNVYLHCWGGHGRAGTIGAMVIGLWYRIDFGRALRLLKESHDTRGYGVGGPRSQYKTPQTQEQVRQVGRFYADLEAHRRMSRLV